MELSLGLLFWSIAAGIVGTGLLDIADRFMERVSFTTGGT